MYVDTPFIKTLQQIVEVAGPAVAPHVAQRLSDFAAGDRSIVADLAHALTSEQLSGRSALPDPLPIDPSRVPQLSRLGAAEQRLLLFSALSITGAVVDVLDASAVEQDVLLFGKVRESLLIEGGKLEFRDAKTRAAVLASTPPAEQRMAHEALARLARKNHDKDSSIWHHAHTGRVLDERAVRALLVSAEEHLSEGALRRAAALAMLASDFAPPSMEDIALCTAGLASFWAGEMGDADQRFAAADSTSTEVASAVRDGLFVSRSLTMRADREIFSHEHAMQIFTAGSRIARNPIDRYAFAELAAVADAVYGDAEQADALQARLYLALSDGRAMLRARPISPHAEAHIIMMQIAFQSQGADRTGAAELLRGAVPRLPMVLPAAGVVTSYLQLLTPFSAPENEILIAAYEAIGPAELFRYNGDGRTLGHGPAVGRRAVAAAALSEAQVTGTLYAAKSLTEVGVNRDSVWGEVSLSRRQNEVLLQMLKGLSNKEIASKLGISHRTVEVHVANVLEKYGMRTRTELLASLSSGFVAHPHEPDGVAEASV